MTGDLELFLRGLYVNRWPCSHRVKQSYDPETDVYSYTCVWCGCVATLENGHPMRYLAQISVKDLVFVSTPVGASSQWIKDRFVNPR